MKNLKTLLLIAVFTLSIGGVVNAQTAHINFEQLVQEMPETKALKSSIQKLEQTYKNEIDGMGKTLEAKLKKYDAEQNTQTKDTNEKRALEVQQDRAKFDQARQFAYKDMQEKQNSGILPLIEKARKAVTDVAASKGILYVFDSSLGKGLLVSKGDDIFNDVKAKLGF